MRRLEFSWEFFFSLPGQSVEQPDHASGMLGQAWACQCRRPFNLTLCQRRCLCYPAYHARFSLPRHVSKPTYSSNSCTSPTWSTRTCTSQP